MRSKKLLLSAIGLSGLLFLAACGSKETPTHVLLPEMLPSGGSTLSEVQIQTLADPKKVSGPAAVVYASPKFTVTGFSGDAAQPQLSESGRVWIPMDVDSSAALSIYYSYEKIMQFEKLVYPKSLVRWPRQVAFDLKLLNGGSDNAFYAGDYDVTVIVPYTLGGLPIAFNSGIVAHEHFHAHFHSLFANGDSPTEELHLHGMEAKASVTGSCGLPYIFNVSKNSEPFQRAVNEMIYRSWNEGLADFYAAIVTGAPNFFDESLPGEGRRHVATQDFKMTPRSTFEAAVKNDVQVQGGIARRDKSCVSLQLAYEQGSQVARVVYAHYLSKYGESANFKEEVAKDFFATLSQSQTLVNQKFSSSDLQPIWILTQLGALQEKTPPEEVPNPISNDGPTALQVK